MAQEPKISVAMPFTFTDVVHSLKEVLGLADDVTGKVKAIAEFYKGQKSKKAAKSLDVVNTPPPEGGGFGLRLKAGSVGLWADYCQLSRRRLPLFESNFADVSPSLSSRLKASFAPFTSFRAA